MLKQQTAPTLLKAFEDYITDRRDLRPSSIAIYEESIKRAGDLLNKRIDDIKYSDIKRLYTNLRYDQGYKPASIELLNNILLPIFRLAVKDDILQKNPVDGAYKEVAKGQDWKSFHKPALSAEEQKRFLDFVSNSIYKRWEYFFIFMFGTGVRIGEAIALRWEDVSFIDKTISINRNLYYRKGSYYEGPPKTEAGIRIIPMLPEVAMALAKQNEIDKLLQVKTNTIIPGETGPVFISSKGTLLYSSTVNNTIKKIVDSYNKENHQKPLPYFSVHQIRHSFCSRLCEQDVNLKVIQTVMGHSDFETTMNIYAEVSAKKKQIVFDGLEGKIIV